MKFYTNFYQKGNKIFVRGYNFGERFTEEIRYNPYLFIRSQKPDSPYRTHDGKIVDKVEFDSISEAREFIQKYSQVDNFPIYGLTNWQYAYINDHYQYSEYVEKLIRCVNIDIETKFDETGFPHAKYANHEIIAITLQWKHHVFVLGLKDFDAPENVNYIKCVDEVDLLHNFLRVWKNIDPDVVTGWNIDRFDIPYIVNRIRKILSNEDAKSLSPYGIINDKTVNTKFGEELMYEIVGVASLDYLELYKKFSFKVQESYALDYICEEELSENKLDYSEYTDLMDLYNRNPQKFMEYNIHDVLLVKRLNDKLGFLEQAYAIAYRTKTNYVDAFTSVRMWDVIIHNYLLEQNIVIPTTNGNRKQKQIVGGHVKDPLVGKYEWFCSFDANSLYPHLIRQYNISPDTYVGKNNDWVFSSQEELDANIERIIKNKDIGLDVDGVCMSASGCYFSTKKRGFLGELMIMFYDGRTVHKKKMLEYKKEKETCTDEARKEELVALIAKEHNMQLALKILLNSCYGSLANEYFRWYNDDLAESVTSSGQLSIRWAAYKFNLFMNNLAGTKDKDYVIAIDTDSVYLNMQVIVDKYLTKKPDATKTEISDMLDNFCNKVMNDYIEKSFEELRSIMHGYEQAMHMKRENIASGIFIAKKRYASYIFNEEGVPHAKPKLKITGLESLRSSTPRVCRKALNETIELMFSKNQEDLIKYVDNFRSKFYNMSFEEVAKPSGVNGIVDYVEQDGSYKKGTPQHVKGAILYNQLLKKLNLQNKYRQITDGSKLRLINLKMPNPIRDNVFACPNELPQEFGLEDYIDYELQFQKTYLDPINAISKVVGWKTEDKESLDLFYS